MNLEERLKFLESLETRKTINVCRKREGLTLSPVKNENIERNSDAGIPGPSRFADFILADRNVYQQRKFLVQMDTFYRQKMPMTGMIWPPEDRIGNEVTVPSVNIKTWNHVRVCVSGNSIGKIPDSRRNSSNGKQGSLWSSLFHASSPAVNDQVKKKKKRIFGDPLYILHLVKLCVQDGQEERAIRLLSTGLASLSILKKSRLQSQVNWIFLRALDAGMDDLVILMLNSGFPGNVNDPIYGGKWKACQRRFPSYFMIAVSLGRIKIVRLMLETLGVEIKASARSKNSVQINKSWAGGLGPLMMAKGNFQLCKLLIQNGADITKVLHYSVYSRYFLHWPRKEKIEKLKVTGMTQVKKVSSHQRHPSRAKSLIFKNTCILPLDIACTCESFETAHYILSAYSSVGKTVESEFCLLVQDDVDLTIALLKMNRNLVNQRDPRGNTPLHYAARRGKTNLLAVYLYYGIKVDSLNFYRSTALHEAARFGNKAAMQLLISRGANCSLIDDEGRTALQLARKQGISSEDLYDFFHYQKSDLERKDEDDNQFNTFVEKIIESRKLIGLDEDDDETVMKRPKRSLKKREKTQFMIEKLFSFPRKIMKRSWWRSS